MAPRPSPYTASSSQLSALISSTSYPAIPPPAELEALQATLQGHAQYVASRITNIEVAETRAQAERERKKIATSPINVLKKEGRTASPNPSEVSTSAAGHSQAVRQGLATNLSQADGQVKKKKLKRVLDSDDEPHGPPQQRPRIDITSPQASTSGLKLKLSSQPAFHHTPAHSSVDFTLPPPPLRQLIPPRPQAHEPPKPGPKRQADVDEDFSNIKVAGQVNFQTFWQGVEPYLREVREDDLAMLGFKADAPELFEIPARGRHYQDVWDEEDGLPAGTTPHHPISASPKSGRVPPHLSHFVPANDLKDEALAHERGLGVITERIVAAVQAEGHLVLREGGGGEVREREKGEKLDVAKIDVVELEERMKRELRAVMLLGEHEEFDPSAREDDEITSALRQCQRQLKSQSALNTARKAKLAEVAKLRLAYSEYTAALEGVEKAIESAWLKRSKKLPSSSTGTKKPGSIETRSRLPVADNVKKLVAVRAKWKQTVGKSFEELEQGVVAGLPVNSIYDGIGETEKKE